MSDVIPTLNKTKFPGMPIRLKSGKFGYLIEYREGNPCPYVVGLGTNTTMYLKTDSIIEDPDNWPGPLPDKVVTKVGNRQVTVNLT